MRVRREKKAQPESAAANPLFHGYVGIDPGGSGAIAIISRDLEVLGLYDWPGDEVGAANIVRSFSSRYSLLAALEKVHSLPPAKKVSTTSMFKFGTGYGIWKGILASFQIPFVEVPPRTWQKGVLKKAQDKKPAMASAARLFPTAELYGPRGGKKDGRADALLIADWCRRQFIKEGENDESIFKSTN